MNIAEQVHHACIERKKKLALAESCTGGAIAARLTAIPDASLYFLGSIVAYSPVWKEQFLLVPTKMLVQHGAESDEVVREMVGGVLDQTEADYAIAVSGFAGPTGAHPGRVFIGIGEKGGEVDTMQFDFSGSRNEVIRAAVDAALNAFYTWITNE